MRTLKADNPALKKGTTIFLKQVKEPWTVKRLLQPASANKKLGGGKAVVTKGKWKHLPMYSLSLEERATCPRTCQQWSTCYGNNMPFANRISHGSSSTAPKTGQPSLTESLETEISSLLTKYPTGIVVRLHVLGDFYSADYVQAWINWKKKWPNLQIFGYTHRAPTSAIGRKISSLNKAGAWVRWSDRGGPMSANVDQAGATAEGITCPEQLGKTASCLTCGLCWATEKAIRFVGH